ncbi:MAG: M48 family metalloprotease [Proteobacteria bacterium]|nr:M48 family metalloprotease [Pseudomonadota bacterium]MBU1594561.1 M48 family metalloprotease [Pseudomonadota bacterium]
MLTPFRRMPLAASLMAALLLVLAPCRAWALFGSMTVGDEIEMGKKFDHAIRAQMPFVDDPEVVAYVKEVVDRVAAALPPQPFPIRSAVVAHGSMNAFAIPGGYIYIFTGLILNVDNEDELAAVISHELGHVTERHVAKRIDQMRFVSIASIAGVLAGALLGAGGGHTSSALGQALATGSMAGAQSAFLMYTRENEREADQVGINYLTKSGYNPDAMPRTFEIMNKRRWFMSGDNVPSYLMTHPGLDERIGYLRDRIRRMPAATVAREFNREKFLRIQTIVRARMSGADTALAYYDSRPKNEWICLDNAGKGIALDRLKRMALAEQSFEAALACGPDDPLVLREAGIFYFNHGEFAKAGPYLQKAATLNPRDAMSMFFTARLMAERKDYKGAISTMERVAREVPEDAEVRQHLGRIYGESGDLFAAHLQLTYAALYSRDKKKTDFHLARVKTLVGNEDQKKQLAALEKTIRDRFENAVPVEKRGP